MEKNINRGFTDQSLFEIGPIFTGKKPGDQITVVCGIKKQLSNEESDKRINSLDVFEIKKDLIQTLVELGINKNEILIDDKKSTIDSWNAKGGTAIFYQNADQVINDLQKLGL